MAKDKKDSEEKQEKKEEKLNNKTIITIVIVILAVAAAYLALSKPVQGDELAFLKGQKQDAAAFIENLQDAEKAFIVQDLRGSDENVRKNIQQCGIDFAGSAGLVTKDTTTFAFEGEKCISIDNPNGNIKSCMNRIRSDPKSVLFYIKGAENANATGTEAYPSVLLIKMGTVYQYKTCNVNVKVQPAQNVTGNASNITN